MPGAKAPPVNLSELFHEVTVTDKGRADFKRICNNKRTLGRFLDHGVDRAWSFLQILGSSDEAGRQMVLRAFSKPGIVPRFIYSGYKPQLFDFLKPLTDDEKTALLLVPGTLVAFAEDSEYYANSDPVFDILRPLSPEQQTQLLSVNDVAKALVSHGWWTDSKQLWNMISALAPEQKARIFAVEGFGSVLTNLLDWADFEEIKDILLSLPPAVQANLFADEYDAEQHTLYGFTMQNAQLTYAPPVEEAQAAPDEVPPEPETPAP